MNMSDDQIKKFEWVTTQLANLSVGSHSSIYRPMSKALYNVFAKQVVEFFPEVKPMMEKLKAEQDLQNQGSQAPVNGPELWKELHERAKTKPKNESAELVWLREFAKKLPAGCACLNHYLTYLKQHPPTFDDYQGWMIKFHNAVNVRVGHAVMPNAEAMALWA